MFHRTLARLAVPLLLAAAFASAQQPVLKDQESPATKAPRLHVIGASVSGGFRDGGMTGAKEKGDTVTMQQLLKPWCGEHAKATTHNTLQMTTMFTSPDEIGEAQIQGVLKAKPDAVVAIDFPFWFAYGAVRGADEKAARSEHFAKGLALLAKLEMPVLVGDLPDMTGAAPRMLSPSWVPSPEVLKALNADLAAFAKQHQNVHLVPLSQIVKTMKTDGAALPLASGSLQTAPGALLQEDRLHANRLGMAFLGYTLQDSLRSLFEAGHPLRQQQWTLEQFVEACGAENDLENVRAAAKRPAPAGAGK